MLHEDRFQEEPENQKPSAKQSFFSSCSGFFNNGFLQEDVHSFLKCIGIAKKSSFL